MGLEVLDERVESLVFVNDVEGGAGDLGGEPAYLEGLAGTEKRLTANGR